MNAETLLLLLLRLLVLVLLLRVASKAAFLSTGSTRLRRAVCPGDRAPSNGSNDTFFWIVSWNVTLLNGPYVALFPV